MKEYNRDKFYKLRVTNICEWISFLLKLQGRNAPHCSCGTKYVEYEKWVFRGQANADWQLCSAFERKLIACENHNLPERVLRLSEITAIDAFKREVRLKFSGIEEQSNVDWLGLMQHYGTPTRLLDFTDSAFVSLFFAVANDPTTDYAVWAVRLNGMPSEQSFFANRRKISSFRKKLERYGQEFNLPPFKAGEAFARNHPNQILQLFSRLFSRYSCIDEKIRKNHRTANMILGRTSRGIPRRAREPFVLPIRLAHNNERIAAQSGLFLMPSMLSRPFDENLRYSLGNPKEIEEDLQISDKEKLDTIIHESLLIKFIFPRATLQEAKVLLECSNISAKTLFPGVEGTAKSVEYFKSIGESYFSRFTRQYIADLRKTDHKEIQ